MLHHAPVRSRVHGCGVVAGVDRLPNTYASRPVPTFTNSSRIFQAQQLIHVAYPSNQLIDVLSLADADTINQAAIAQPACTALQIGLVTLLKSLGVSPAHVIGHSSGTYLGS